MEQSKEETWLVMFHQLPPKPAYLRVKVWRRLQSFGAILVKNSVYLLPLGDQAQEDLQWLLREIEQEGGTGTLCEARLIDGLTSSQVREMFRASRGNDYTELFNELRTLAAAASSNPVEQSDEQQILFKMQLSRFRRRLAQIIAIDFFGAPGRVEVENLFEDINRSLVAKTPAMNEGEDMMGKVLEKPDLTGTEGHFWVTRQNVWVDRMASAWLIRRFIDTKARFKFVAEKDYIPQIGEVRFDMFEAEFTHEGSLCTFEVLLTYAQLRHDPALIAIAEIVHDIDMKDSRFGRDEAAGISLLLDGIIRREQDDSGRIARSGPIFDDLYESLSALFV